MTRQESFIETIMAKARERAAAELERPPVKDIGRLPSAAPRPPVKDIGRVAVKIER